MSNRTETLTAFEARLNRETDAVHKRELADIDSAYQDALRRALDKHRDTIARARAIEAEKPPPETPQADFDIRKKTRLRTLYRTSGLLRDIAQELKTASRDAKRIAHSANERMREINLEEYHGADRYG